MKAMKGFYPKNEIKLVLQESLKFCVALTRFILRANFSLRCNNALACMLHACAFV